MNHGACMNLKTLEQMLSNILKNKKYRFSKPLWLFCFAFVFLTEYLFCDTNSESTTYRIIKFLIRILICIIAIILWGM